VNLSELPNAHMVIAGPNCQPFARSGDQARWADSRANVFSKTLDCIEDQAKRQGSVLEVFIIENVLGMADAKDKGPIPVQFVENWLIGKLGPEWKVWTWKVSTAALGSPQNRWRLYICGRKVDRFSMPQPDLQPGQFKVKGITLEAVLDPSLPREDAKLTKKQKANLAYYKKVHAKDPRGTIAVCDLSRSHSKQKTRLQSRNDGLVPTLTTRNRHLFVFKVGHDNEFYRYISPVERFMLQGFSPEVVEIPASKVLAATGNAMSVGAIGITM
ncbi:unnamed protein product, partial [Prorocentrum cordatum]